jgi:hypothetical protein
MVRVSWLFDVPLGDHLLHFENTCCFDTEYSRSAAIMEGSALLSTHQSLKTCGVGFSDFQQDMAVQHLFCGKHA